MPEEYYQSLVRNEALSFRKMLRLVSYGIMKKLTSLEKKDIQQVIVIYEAFNQIVGISQKIHKVEEKKYKTANILTTEKGIYVSQIRKVGQEEKSRIIPIIEDKNLQKKIIMHLHTYTSTGIDSGRGIHHSANTVIKLNYANEFGMYCPKLYQVIADTLQCCTICKLKRKQMPTQKKGRKITMMAWSVNFKR